MNMSENGATISRCNFDQLRAYRECQVPLDRTLHELLESSTGPFWQLGGPWELFQTYLFSCWLIDPILRVLFFFGPGPSEMGVTQATHKIRIIMQLGTPLGIKLRFHAPLVILLAPFSWEGGISGIPTGKKIPPRLICSKKKIPQNGWKMGIVASFGGWKNFPGDSHRSLGDFFH